MPEVRTSNAGMSDSAARKRAKRRPGTLDEARLTALRDEELAWLAALATSARGLQPSLREFLR